MNVLKRFLLFITCIVTVVTALAQERQISVRVTSAEDNTPFNYNSNSIYPPTNVAVQTILN